ncbi:unnamed protein product [Coffea canephora]|uniref:Uncharacterized protein n=1 Tax=Coffea canephora TaxID=49390 RepID=A0A068U0H0_COFCA|nr:unnamed protein product [Coffea canephora]
MFSKLIIYNLTGSRSRTKSVVFLQANLLVVDLITTLTKLSSLGQQINYEAYTYPVQKIELSKLKL